MAAKSSSSAYGTVAVTIHWLSVLLILVLIGSGFRAGQMTDPAAKASILAVHAPVGIAVLLLTLARIVWWWRFDDKPQPLGDAPPWQERVAGAVHVLFYVVLLGMAASGIGMFVLSGAGPIVFGVVEGRLPDFHDFPPRVPHGLGARLLVALLVIHAGAALYHHIFLRDRTLKRMWFGAE